jgi:hypothetical protein
MHEFKWAVAAAGSATFLLSALAFQPEAIAQTVGMPPGSSCPVAGAPPPAAVIALTVLGNQPAAVAATAGETPLPVADSWCPRIGVLRCPKNYKVACTEYFHRGVYAWRRCCAKMGCVPNIPNLPSRPIDRPRPFKG